MKYSVTVAGRSFEIEVEHDRLVWVNGRPLYVDLEQVGGLPVYSLALDDTGYVLFVEKGQERYQVEVQGQVYPVAVKLRRPRLASQRVRCPSDGESCLSIRAPLAGRLVSTPALVGDRIEAGQVLAVVESMKMQMELKAPEAGVVEAIHGSPDREVAQGEELVTLRVE
jgi:biotin carboxyl carrier protein